MGQYWKVVNLDKREFINPHKLGSSSMLWEQLVNTPGIGAALIILCAAMPEPRGGGDLKRDDDVARRTIGRWAGDRVCLVGDYAEDSDLPGFPGFSKLYSLCVPASDSDNDGDGEDKRTADQLFTDVSDDVCTIIERELGGKFEGDGWRKFKSTR
jgi:hypothetical protein